MSGYIQHSDWSHALEHHGILGMKWGVRRYQNADGTLTEKGKARYSKVSESKHLQKKQTKQALKTLKKEKKIADKNVKTSDIAAERRTAKSNAYLKKAGKANHFWRLDKDKVGTYFDKAYANLDEATKASDYASRFIEESRLLEVKIDKISSGDMKAGRDFIVQTDYNFFPNSKERRIIEKQK